MLTTTKSFKTLALLTGVAILTLGATHAEARDNDYSGTYSRDAGRHVDAKAHTSLKTKAVVPGTNAAGKPVPYNAQTATSKQNVTSNDAYDVNTKARVPGGLTESTEGSLARTQGEHNNTTMRNQANADRSTSYYRNVNGNTTEQYSGRTWSKNRYSNDVSNDVKVQSTSGTYSKNP